MEQQQDIENSPLMNELAQKLPKMNFYRFCQILEQLYGESPLLGCAESPLADPVRFAPAPEMSFPSGELKCIEKIEHLPRRTTIRTRFLGLYGVDSILPQNLLDNIVCREQGYEAMTDFLDMFNHRLLTLYYRIWLKYHYPACFLSGGRDAISQCLLGLTGMGITGTSEQIAAPASRFLSLLGLITQRTRTAEGLMGLVRVLINQADVEVQEFYPIWQQIDNPVKLGGQGNHSLRLGMGTVLGSSFSECNQTVHIIKPQVSKQIPLLFPGGELHQDLMSLLRAYLGYRVDAQLTLQIKNKFLPVCQLKTDNRARLGQTTKLSPRKKEQGDDELIVSVNIGRYCGLEFAA